MTLFIGIVLFCIVIGALFKNAQEKAALEELHGLTPASDGSITFDDIRCRADECEYRIAGITHRELSRRDVGYSDHFMIKADRTNRYDKYAVEIYNDRGRFVGYIERGRNKYWHNRLVSDPEKSTLECRGYVGMFLQKEDDCLEYYGRIFLPVIVEDEEYRKIMRGTIKKKAESKSILAPTLKPQSAELTGTESTKQPEPSSDRKESRIVTTEEEMQGFYIVRSILYPEMDDINRVVHRDTQSYFGILLDDNNRKPICRLHFNSSNKYIETFDAERKGSKHLLQSLNDIYKYRNEIVAACKMY